MKLPVFAIASNIATSLGLSTAAVWDQVMAVHTGISRYEDEALSAVPFWASRISSEQWGEIRRSVQQAGLTPFEQMAVFSAQHALAQVEIDLRETVLILATTKGNIEGLETDSDQRNLLTTSAAKIAEALGIPDVPVVISHACVSGVTALQYGFRMLEAGRYKQAVVVGADRFTRFVLSGFQSFQAVADEPCRPFDAARKGINLGEAAATIVLSTDSRATPLARICGGATSNDANHISGPSRTGAELADAITRAMQESQVRPSDIGMISAHGTATLYNDEMESKAFALAGLLDAPVQSIKGYAGHTLGAAGVLESALCIEALRHQQLIPSLGFHELGVPEPIQVITKPVQADLRYVLKTASGFGGCNAAIVLMR